MSVILKMDLFGKEVTATKECITPYKISLLVLISELCDKKLKQVCFPNAFKKYRHSLMLLLLNWIEVGVYSLD